MMWAGVICWLLVADGPVAPKPMDPFPPALRAFLQQEPAALPNHVGYLKELARLPELAATETAWWRARTQPALRNLDTQFDEVLGESPEAQSRFDTFYAHLRENPELRSAVENLVRTELDKAKASPEMTRAVQYLRGHPDVAMRFLTNPSQVRPLPEALQGAYDAFLEDPEWMASLRTAFQAVLDTPEAYEAVLPWWEQLEKLGVATSESGEGLPTELYQHPRELWLWHLRNINRARNDETRPWIRYWNRLIHRDPLLAQEYGPFINQLLQEPEQLRQHLATLQDLQTADAEPWPPKMKPPTLPPLDMSHPALRMQQRMNHPEGDSPGAAIRPAMKIPQRPVPPVFPEFPRPETKQSNEKSTGPTFPTFPEFPTGKRSTEKGRTPQRPPK